MLYFSFLSISNRQEKSKRKAIKNQQKGNRKLTERQQKSNRKTTKRQQRDNKKAVQRQKKDNTKPAETIPLIFAKKGEKKVLNLPSIAVRWRL